MVKVITNYSNYTDGDLSVQAKTVIADMTSNTNFADPLPALIDVQTALTAYDNALAAAMGGSQQQTAVKNQSRATLETLLSQLAVYVQLNCNNDEAIALSSGFKLAKAHQPVGALPKPENLIATADKAGQISLSVQPIPHATAYLWQYKTVADTVWVEILSTKSKTIITGLTSGMQYSFMVCGIGTNPAQTWSDEVKSYVL